MFCIINCIKNSTNSNQPPFPGWRKQGGEKPAWWAASTARGRPAVAAAAAAHARRRRLRARARWGWLRRAKLDSSGGPTCESSLAPCSEGAASSYASAARRIWGERLRATPMRDERRLRRRGASEASGCCSSGAAHPRRAAALLQRRHGTCEPRLWLRQPERRHQ
jgi:hypothetical protein